MPALRDRAPSVELFGDQLENVGLRLSPNLLDQLDPVRTYIMNTENLVRRPSRQCALGWLVKRGYELSKTMLLEDIADPALPLATTATSPHLVYTKLQIDKTTWRHIRMSILADKSTIPVRITSLAMTALQITRPVTTKQETRC